MAKMNVQIIKVFAAHGDGGEKSRGPIIGIFSRESTAKEFAKGQGWYGSDGCVSERYAMKVSSWPSVEKVYLLDEKDPIDLDRNLAKVEEDLRSKALGKLTEEEKRVLGLTK